jgi:hypothetical protein
MARHRASSIAPKPAPKFVSAKAAPAEEEEDSNLMMLPNTIGGLSWQCMNCTEIFQVHNLVNRTPDYCPYCGTAA